MAAAVGRTRIGSGPSALGAKTIPPDHAILAVPKKGRLHEQVKKLLEGTGLEYTRPDRTDVAVCSNLPIVIVFLPASDIAKFVGEGNVDLGITGLDHIKESEVDVEVLVPLGFGKCSLSVQAPVTSRVTDIKEQLCGARIATSFPVIAAEYFKNLDPSKTTQIRELSGSVEAACGLGLADAVVDLVETGTTMRAAGLEEVEVILKTEAVLLANKQSAHKATVALFQTRVEGYLTAMRYMMMSYNAPRDQLKAVLAITPGKRSPTVSPLEDGEWCAVSALVLKKGISEVMDRLQEAGATDILIYSITNSRM
mmetsp:Transcript_88161/g.176323  ORF Transcript_88161/g.176323 Transcript_88161/m.176323 type:complete len:310 (+) Transcript_88161:41-970(+)|eukprot:CAMPEP_0171653452 /NCGR_PEP_ID=MMETSP0990-20121206/39560_1 /TAXON_ID=483369 /ORGANISM="non described non described, Strain CCMP2098" /LENGTH=309 /DNA_ID=CAMNT_0012232869 /DNA_START=9 /DNA_END=938 /DNA_ORIENTATION=+